MNKPNQDKPAQPSVEVAVKPIWQSKTFWVGIIQTIIAILTFVPTVDGVVGDEWLRYILLASGILTVVLRQLTEGPVSTDGNLEKKAALVTTAQMYRRPRKGKAAPGIVGMDEAQ